jgi:hypothetical protein
LKGCSGDIIILEEAAYIDQGLVNEVVVPLLSMQQSVLLCISTLLDQGNHYSKMMMLKDEYGRHVFENISITLVCDECLKTDTPEQCKHKMSTLPRWLSSSKVEVVKNLLAEDPAMLLRETLGISTDGSQKCFGAKEITALFERKAPPLQISYREVSQNVKHIFVSCDPSGGGASAFSIASCLIDGSGFYHVRSTLF